MSQPLQGTQSAANAIQRVAYTHDAMIDLMLANPAITNGQLATHFGYTQAWVSRVVNSDAFNARLAERKDEVVDPAIRSSLEEKFKAVADSSLDILLNKLHATNSAELALKVLDVSSRSLGYGARQAAGPVVQNNFVVALPPKSADAEAWVSSHRPGQIIEATEVTESKESA